MLKKCSITKVVAKVMYWMILTEQNVLDNSDLNVLGSYALIYDSEWRSTVICFIYYLTYCQERFTTGWYVFNLKSFTSLTCAGLLMQMLHNVCDANNFAQFCQKPCRKETSVSRVYIHTLFAGSNRRGELVTSRYHSSKILGWQQNKNRQSMTARGLLYSLT